MSQHGAKKGAAKSPGDSGIAGVEKIMAGDCTVTINRVLAIGRLYAASSAQNGSESMFPIQRNTLQSRGWKNTSFEVSAETPRTKQLPLPAPPKPRITKANYRRAGVVIREKVQQWCFEHPGFALTKVGPGSRGASSTAREFYTTNGVRIIGSRSKGGCLKFAIVNAVARLKSDNDAIDVHKALSTGDTHFRSIGSSQRTLHKLGMNLNLRKIRDPAFHSNKFAWLANRSDGFWLVRLRAGNSVDHCCMIDGKRAEIVDIEEKNPLRLCEAALRACGGEDADGLYIAEVREICSSKASK